MSENTKNTNKTLRTTSCPAFKLHCWGFQHHHQDADVVSPAVGQVQSDAATYVRSEAHVSNGSQADVEKGDDAHPQIQNAGEALRPLHLVLQGKNLQNPGKTSTVSPGQQTKTKKEQNTHIL